ncbi:DNA polymerase I [Clostridiaceae bacterium M8S5]|nr:DNA polymerase I [Clostridiaceae bacterium M8S5]
MTNKKMVLIDGNSLLHRAYYALPLLSTKEGIYTNAVYGFLTMYYKILDDYDPSYVCVAFDRKAPTFRHKEYDKYKAGRSKTPDELGEQFSLIREVLSCLGITYIEIDGFEADDIIGTLSKKFDEEGFQVIIVTGDKDLLQLTTDRIKVWITRKGVSEVDIYDKDVMLEKYGLTPNQFIDLKALMGDQSDNIPGVPGVGEKTGIKLLKQYNSLDNIYDNLDDIKAKKLNQNLTENKVQAYMSRKLAEIITNVPIDINADKIKMKDIDSNLLYDLYKKLMFKSLLSRVPNINTEERNYKSEYKIINNLSQIDEVINKIIKNESFAFKFVDNFKELRQDNDIIGLVVGIDSKLSYYIPFASIAEDILLLSSDCALDKDAVIDKFRQVFEDKSIDKIGHDLKSDILILFKNKIDVKSIKFDTKIAQYLINPSQKSYSLKTLAEEYLSIEIKDEEDLLGKGKYKKSYKSIENNKLIEYFCNKISIIQKLYNVLEGKLIEMEMVDLFENIEMPLIEVLASMEHVGFKVDIKVLKELGEEFKIRIEELTKDIYNIAGEEFNINSPKQLGIVLFEKLKLPVIKKTKTGYSTNAEVLEKLQKEHEIVEKVLEYRKLVKLKNTYVDGFLPLIDKKTNRIHSSFKQTITTTGRISSTEPNLQNIPIRTEEGRKLRKVFVAGHGNKLVDADYSQIELRVLAHISADYKLIEAFENDEDIHTKTASEVFDVPKNEVTNLMRSRAKAVNFGIVYGISDFGLSRDLNIPRKESKTYIDNYLKNYKQVAGYMKDIIRIGKEDGYVSTIQGRRRYLPELNSKNFNIKSSGERLAMNTPIQGSAADIIKIAMVSVYFELKKRKLKSKLILQVHDELIIEAHENELEEVKKILQDLMENAIDIKVPLKVDMQVGESWYDTK